MMGFRIVISRVVIRVLRGTAGLGVAVSVGCMAEHQPGFSELGDADVVDFRADGCGAKKEPRVVLQTCHHKGRARNPWLEKKPLGEYFHANGVCKNEEELKCYYTYTGCVMDTTANECTAPKDITNPACAEPADKTPTIAFEWTFELLEGSQDCVAPAKPNEACLKHIIHKINGKDDPVDILMGGCEEKSSDSIHFVQCCIPMSEPGPGGATAGPECSGQGDGECGGEGETGTSWTTTSAESTATIWNDTTGWNDTSWNDTTGWSGTSWNGTTSWHGSMTEDDSVGSSASSGESGGSGGSWDAGSGGEGCPEGTTWQCGTDDGPIPGLCICATQQPDLLAF